MKTPDSVYKTWTINQPQKEKIILPFVATYMNLKDFMFSARLRNITV